MLVLKENLGGKIETPHWYFLIILLLRYDVTLTSTSLTHYQHTSNFLILLLGRFCQDIENEKVYARVSWNCSYLYLAPIVSGLQKS